MRVLAPRRTASAAQRLAELAPLLDQLAARAHQLALDRATVLAALAERLPEDAP
jgi:hypothetical protein